MNSLGLYLQIPFCASKCSFCNFNSGVFPSTLLDPYTESLCREIEQREIFDVEHGILPPSRNLPVDTLYFGGGTPALLGPRRLGCILDLLRRSFHWDREPEITMEMTPGSASKVEICRYAAWGLNRLSIGAQTFDPAGLRVLGRLHDVAGTHRTFDLARSSGMKNISLDLILGLPHHTLDSWKQTLDELLDLRPEHISLYLFEIDSQSRLGREVLAGGTRFHAAALPEEELWVDSYWEAQRRITGAGYEHYEISNFALPGFRSRHNLKYWQCQPYLGFGSGAHSFHAGFRWANETSPETYIEKVGRGESPRTECHVLTTRETLEESLFLGLRQRGGVSLASIRDQMGLDPSEVFSDTFRRLQAWGMIERVEGRVRLTDRALLISNEVFQEFVSLSDNSDTRADSLPVGQGEGNRNGIGADLDGPYRFA